MKLVIFVSIAVLVACVSARAIEVSKRDEQKRFLEIITDLYSSVLFPAVDNLAQCREIIINFIVISFENI